MGSEDIDEIVLVRKMVESIFPDSPDLEIILKHKEKELDHPLTIDECMEFMKEAILSKKKENLKKDKEEENIKIINLSEIESFLSLNKDYESFELINLSKVLVRKKTRVENKKIAKL